MSERARILVMGGTILLLSSIVSYGWAQEKEKFQEEVKPTVTVQTEVTAAAVSHLRDSAKFTEYRAFPPGSWGDVMVRYRRGAYILEALAKNIARDDQLLQLTSQRFGWFKLDLTYDKIPHRFAFDAQSLFSGIGTGNLQLSPRLQSDLQSSRSPTDLVSRILGYLPGAATFDEALFRKTFRADLKVVAWDPFRLTAETRFEKREGTRPFSGNFGFGNVVEIPEPIDYDTTQVRLAAEYGRKPLFVNVSYYFSDFANNIDTLTWANPYRATDSTTATAYRQSYLAGPASGLIDLYPNNRAHYFSFSGVLMDLPLESRLSATASFGRLTQNDPLVPYTTNRAIRKGAPSRVPGEPVPFDAWDKASLPIQQADLKVDVTQLQLLLTSKPLRFTRLKLKYNFYHWDNKSEQIHFPGRVWVDAVWEPEPAANIPTGFKKNSFSVDLGLDVWKSTTLTLGYRFIRTDRVFREVAEQDDNIFKVALDTTPLSWLTLRAAYERSRRRGEYDFMIPFIASHLGEEEVRNPPQLPFLRKYDQANRDRDSVLWMVSVAPTDKLTLSGSVVYGKDNFRDSPFGLLNDRRTVYSVDADYALTEQVSLFAFYSFEGYKNSQKVRQWARNGVGDPYVRETGLDSLSNWTSDEKDKLHSLGGGLQAVLLKPRKLTADVSYTYSKSDGAVAFVSPVGTSANDANPFEPVSFDQVDDVRFHVLNASLRYSVTRGLTYTLGALWEKFRYDDDLSTVGFAYIPVTAAGAFNEATLMGTQLKGYNVTVFYMKVSYTF